MKISKSVLNAMVIGLTAAAVTSCEKAQLEPAVSHDNIKENPHCEIDEKNPEGETIHEGWENCPACGMG